jgi:hypothetical protein
VGVYTSPQVIDYQYTDRLLLSVLFLILVTKAADHSGRMLKDMKCLRPLIHLVHVFESHSRYGCLSAFLLCLCCSVYVATL